MHHLIKLFIIPIVLLKLGNSNDALSISTRLQTLDTSQYAIFQYSQTYSYYINNGKPTSLAISDINLIAELLNRASEDYNSSKMKLFSGKSISPLQNYKLQLIPALDSNNKKIVFANCFIPMTIYGKNGPVKDYPSDWRSVLVSADGGGSSIFHLTFNLVDSSYSPLITNSQK